MASRVQKFKISLRLRLIFSLVSISTGMLIVGTWVVYQQIHQRFNADIESDAVLVSRFINHTAMASMDQQVLQHMLMEVYKETSRIKLMLVAEKSNNTIIAATIPEWIGLQVMALPDEHLAHELVQSLITGKFTRHFEPGDKELTIITPLDQHLSSHHSYSEDNKQVQTGSLHHEEKHAENEIDSRQENAIEERSDSVVSAYHQITGTAHIDKHEMKDEPAKIKGHQDKDTYSQEQLEILSYYPYGSNRPSATPRDVPRGSITVVFDRVPAMMGAINAILIQGGTIAALILMLAISIYYLVTRQVLKPIEKLIETMRAQKAGDRNARVNVISKDEIGDLAEKFNTMLDVLEKHESSLSKLSTAIEQSPVSVIITDTQHVIEYVNPKFTELTGYSSAEILGKTPQLLHSGKNSAGLYQGEMNTLSIGKPWRGEHITRKKNGECYWELTSISPIRNKQGDITHYIYVNEDISVTKKQEEALQKQANFDALTGLPNRVLAIDRFLQSIRRAHRNKSMVAILFIDLDDFKKVNDTLGHVVGDDLLKQIAERFSGQVREDDTVARFGGDEFIVLLPDIKSLLDVELTAERLLGVCSEPFFLSNQNTYMSLSIGISIYPEDSTSTDELMRNADSAMYDAKQCGGNLFRFFTKEMNAIANEHLLIESELRIALDRQELEVHYQPIIDTQANTICGAEALIRWNSKTLGYVPPAKFIPLAENTHLISPIGEWVLLTACKDAVKWVKQNPDFYISVNVSGRQFQRMDLLGVIQRILKQTGLPAKHLELEVTEGVLLDNLESTREIMTNIKQLGIRLAVDDFGTGYSSLSYVRTLPFDTLKIDRSFIENITQNSDDSALVSSLIDMSHTLGLKVVAEGIETYEQYKLLSESNCDSGQGWLFSKAIAADEFDEFLRQWSEMDFKNLKVS